jgi:hypothetical protein
LRFEVNRLEEFSLLIAKSFFGGGVTIVGKGPLMR